jgi:hypothetical protein
MSFRSSSSFFVFALAAAAPLLGSAVHAQKPSRVAQLGGAKRFLTALSTDKPIYRSGETMWVRGVLLDAFDHTPLREGAGVRVEVKGPKGEVVAAGGASVSDSVWGWSWQVPPGQAGGQYTLHATYPGNGHAPAERRFDVRAFRAPRLKSQIVFLRDGYGPGDKVTATVEVKRAEGGVPAGAKVTAIARVDEVEVARVPATVDERGLCTVSFALPKAIARGEGSLAFAIEDGGVVETAAKTIPILLQTLDLAFFPEGGELVAGVPSRIYFQARTPAQKPADITAVVLDDRGQTVAHLRSEHEGRGRFELTARAGARYTVRIEKPSGIRATWPLPVATDTGVALRAQRELTLSDAAVGLWLGSAHPQKVRVSLSHREVELSSTFVELKGARQQSVWLAARDGEGVLTATVWGEQGQPLAERLIYRKPAKGLAIELRTDKARYVPGDQVKLTARTTRDGKPVSAVIGLGVSDDAVLEMIEKREQAPSLPVMVLLEPEVRELADAHVYLDEKNPKAPLAVDLLLGTQGWRRFALMDVSKAVDKYGDEARRALAMRDQVAVLRMAKAGRREVFDDLLEGAAAAPRMDRPAPAQARHADEKAPAGPPPPMAVAAPPPPVAAAPAPVVAVEAKDKAEADVVGFDAPAEKEIARNKRAVGGLRGQGMGGGGWGFVREYAHQVRAGRRPTDRVDFTETLYWHAGLRTNAQGEATVRFALNDSVTAFKVTAGGFDDGGALGAATASIESVQPFYVEPKLPLEVTTGDTIRLPVSLVNGTTHPLQGALIKAVASSGLRLNDLPRLDLAPGARVRRLMEITVGASATPVELTLQASAGNYADNVSRTLAIKPSGFPFQIAAGGLTVANGSVAHSVTIPAGVVPGSLRATVAVYPTPLANMTKALARLIQDPSGCFEQTSSTSYPLTMAQQYFTSHTGVDPKMIATAQEKLDAGYKRLVSFETKERGYEWFGENPGHEALTAYGLLHFSDMAKVRDIDQGMLARTRDWLLAQRDGKGGFARKRRALHTWIEDQDASNGYIVWALLETGARGLDREIAAFESAATSSQNSYVVALGANVAALAGHKSTARKLSERLAGKQLQTGAVGGGTASIVGSDGEALAIETTSLATLAWLRDPSFAASTERSMKYLADSSQDGRYGSTQSTVLALRAIVAYDQQRARPKAPGSLRVFVDGQPVGAPVRFDVKTQGALVLPDVGPRLVRGAHKIEVRMEGGAPMPYSIAIDYHATTPDSSKLAKVALSVELAKGGLREGELVEAVATVSNLTGKAVPSPIAIVGLPGGLEPRHDQLKELVKKGTIDAYEVRGRDVVLYWRSLGAQQKVAVPVSLLAAVPGHFTAPASRAYLYYTDEHKTWVKPLEANIAPKS